MRRLTLALVICSQAMIECSAAPRTWVQPSVSLLGAAGESRFGAEVECSAPMLGAGTRSLVAVGAPGAALGEGRVFLFDPANASSPVQVVAPDEAHRVSGFGGQVQFLDDINGDGRDELVVATTATLGGNSGRVYGFFSGGSESGAQYFRCGSLEYSGGNKARVQGLRAASGSDTANVVIALPELAQTYGYRLTLSLDNASCSFEPSPTFTTASAAGSEYGASLAQIGVEGGCTIGLGVGAPNSGLAGTISFLKTQEGALQAQSISSSSVTLSGSVVAGSYQSGIFAVGAPQESNGRGSVAVYENSFGGMIPVCTAEVAAADPSEAFGSAISVAGKAFSVLTGSERTSILARRSEDSTGGSVVLFGASAMGCSQMYELNNCQNDPSQEQGSALAAGDSCVTTHAGSQQRMVVSGSPGWNDGRGRVDISIEGEVQSSPTTCAFIESPTIAPPFATLSQSESLQVQAFVTAAPVDTLLAFTFTPTPLALTSPTASPTSNPIIATPVVIATNSSVPTSTNTAAPTASDAFTAVSTSSASPTETPSSPIVTESASPSVSPTPAATNSAVTTPEIGATATPLIGATSPSTESSPVASDRGGSTFILGEESVTVGDQVGGIVHIQDITPIPVYAGVTGLPAPEITVQGSTVTVVMPAVTPRLQPRDYQKVQQQLMKQRRMSAKKARAFIDNPDNLVVTYVFTYQRVSELRRFSLISSAHAADRKSSKKSRVTKVRSRQSTITLQRMPPGTFEGSYTVEVSLKKSRVIIAKSAPSSPTWFRVDG